MNETKDKQITSPHGDLLPVVTVKACGEPRQPIERHPAFPETARKEDLEGVGSRAELEDLVKHMDIHSNYRRCGYDQMTTRQKYLFTETARKLWSWEREETANEKLTRDAGAQNL